jgi:uncharacterized protein (TIGR02453 family)
MTSPFTPKTLSFLRSLKRHNNREWFRAYKDNYDRHVRGPMVQLVEALAVDMRAFAPELVADPKASIYRIYRDTRFGADTAPLKTHVAAHFPARGMKRGEGAGLYVHVSPEGVWAGGGMYMPSSADLTAIRAHIASTHPRLQTLATRPVFTRAVGALTGERLTRIPRGYAKDHPAAYYLQFRQFLAGAEWESGFATSKRFYAEVCTVFRAAVPLVRFLNTAMLDQAPGPPLLASTAVAGALRGTAPRSRPQSAAPRPAPKPMW